MRRRSMRARQALKPVVALGFMGAVGAAQACDVESPKGEHFEFMPFDQAVEEGYTVIQAEKGHTLSFRCPVDNKQVSAKISENALMNAYSSGAPGIILVFGSAAGNTCTFSGDNNAHFTPRRTDIADELSVSARVDAHAADVWTVGSCAVMKFEP